ncbi:MAG: zinc ABC transporter substrate-binding protein [Candidatus Thorarchaeota archaeon]|nr:zinc ABC transporter substrate-binding protein [Candidatus Thorarchaeota archaeon]
MNRKRTVLIPIVLLLLPLIMNSITMEVQAQVQPVHEVAVSVASLAGIVDEVGGSLISTSILLEQEGDPHAFTVTPEIIAMADTADLLVFTGHFHWEEELAILTSTPFITFQNESAWENYEDYGAEYSPMPGEEMEHDHDGNPHAYWLLPKNALAIANVTRVALSTLNSTLTDTWNANFANFEEKMEDLQSLIAELDEIHEFSQIRAIVVSPPEAYVAEAFGIQCDAVLQAGEITLAGAQLLEVQTALRNGSVQLILGSDVAQFQTGGEYAYQLQADNGGTLIWWKTVFYPDADYFSMMTFNLGALVSGIEGRSGSLGDQTVNIGLLSLSLVLGFIAAIEAVLLIQRARAE